MSPSEWSTASAVMTVNTDGSSTLASPDLPLDGFAGYIGSAIDVTELKLASVALSGLSRRLMQSHENERAWIARELNEDLCQRMMGLTLQLHSVSKASRGDVNEMRARVEELCVQFGDVAREIQAVSDQWYSKLEGARTRGISPELLPAAVRAPRRHHRLPP